MQSVTDLSFLYMILKAIFAGVLVMLVRLFNQCSRLIDTPQWRILVVQRENGNPSELCSIYILFGRFHIASSAKAILDLKLLYTKGKKNYFY